MDENVLSLQKWYIYLFYKLQEVFFFPTNSSLLSVVSCELSMTDVIISFDGRVPQVCRCEV